MINQGNNLATTHQIVVNDQVAFEANYKITLPLINAKYVDVQ